MQFRQLPLPPTPRPLLLPFLCHPTFSSQTRAWPSLLAIQHKRWLAPFHVPKYNITSRQTYNFTTSLVLSFQLAATFPLAYSTTMSMSPAHNTTPTSSHHHTGQRSTHCQSSRTPHSAGRSQTIPFHTRRYTSLSYQATLHPAHMANIETLATTPQPFQRYLRHLAPTCS